MINLVMYSDNPQMNIMLSKYKLIDILSMCWSDETASSILDVLINACLTDFYNSSKYNQLRCNLVNSTELMSRILNSSLNSESEHLKIGGLEVLRALLKSEHWDEGA